MEKKYKVYQWICIYPDDVEVMGENLSLDEANALAAKLSKEDCRCNVSYIVQQMFNNQIDKIMTAEKAGLMLIVFTLIQLVCMTGVILCENNTIDWCIICFQALMVCIQILIMVIDTHKTNKRKKL